MYKGDMRWARDLEGRDKRAPRAGWVTEVAWDQGNILQGRRSRFIRAVLRFSFWSTAGWGFIAAAITNRLHQLI